MRVDWMHDQKFAYQIGIPEHRLRELRQFFRTVSLEVGSWMLVGSLFHLTKRLTIWPGRLFRRVNPLSADDEYYVKNTDDESSIMTGSVRVQCTAQPVTLPCVTASTPRGAEILSHA